MVSRVSPGFVADAKLFKDHLSFTRIVIRKIGGIEIEICDKAFGVARYNQGAQSDVDNNAANKSGAVVSRLGATSARNQCRRRDLYDQTTRSAQGADRGSLRNGRKDKVRLRECGSRIHERTWSRSVSQGAPAAVTSRSLRGQLSQVQN